MPPGFEPFLAAVCAEPWADLPRLVFADWLEENGRWRRAEFIRLQCRAALGGPDARTCQSQAARLLHGRNWHQRERPQAEGFWWSHQYRRGFLTDVRVQGPLTAAMLTKAVAVGLIERVGSGYGTPTDNFRVLAGSPDMARVTALDRWWADDAGVMALAGNPSAGRLDRLVMGGHISDNSVRALIDSPHLARLQYVRIGTVATTLESAFAARFGAAARLLTALG